MKTIDTKSLLLGACIAILFLTLTSGKITENNSIEFVGHPNCFGIYNKATKTIYLYGLGTNQHSIEDKPRYIYTVAEDGSSVIKKD